MRSTNASQAADTDVTVAVLGAGPVGLAAAAHLHARGLSAVVLEAGPSAASAVREWGHVRLFSPWRHLVDLEARRLLELRGWQAPPDDSHPTGAELVREMLEPLAGLPEIARVLRLEHRVTAVSRLGIDRMQSAGREEAPFQIVADTPGGEVRLIAKAVIDATGTWRSPNPAGAGGVPAAGERGQAAHVSYGIPDVLGRARERYAGRRTLVVGSGHSAFNAVIDLATLAEHAPGTEVVWAVRRSEVGQMFGGGDEDALSERGALGERARSLVAERGVELVTGFRVVGLEPVDRGVAVVAADGRRLVVDEVVAATGFRPDLGITRELRLDLDHVTEAPVRLAPLIDPNVHSCGTVPAHGEAVLAHPETGYYAVGMKSYGRAPTFLLATGYEQVRSVVAHLAGDHEAAQSLELVLPETGVCCTDLPGSDIPCCGAAASRVA